MKTIYVPKWVIENMGGKLPFCKYCGSDDDLVGDHIIPKAKGGKDSKENIQLICATCNQAKGTKMPEEFDQWLKRLVTFQMKKRRLK